MLSRNISTATRQRIIFVVNSQVSVLFQTNIFRVLHDLAKKMVKNGKNVFGVTSKLNLNARKRAIHQKQTVLTIKAIFSASNRSCVRNGTWEEAMLCANESAACYKKRASFEDGFYWTDTVLCIKSRSKKTDQDHQHKVHVYFINCLSEQTGCCGCRWSALILYIKTFCIQ